MFDQQISGHLVSLCNIPRIISHVIVPSQWEKCHLGHDLIRDFDASDFALSCENARFVVERSSVNLVGSLSLSTHPAIKKQYPDWNDTIFKFRVLHAAHLSSKDPFNTRKQPIDQQYRFKSEAVDEALVCTSIVVINRFLRVFQSGDFMLDRDSGTATNRKPTHYVSNMVSMANVDAENCLVLDQDEYKLWNSKFEFPTRNSPLEGKHEVVVNFLVTLYRTAKALTVSYCVDNRERTSNRRCIDPVQRESLKLYDKQFSSLIITDP